MKISYKFIIRLLGLLGYIEGLAMLPCGFVALHYHESSSALPFFIIGITSILCGHFIMVNIKFTGLQVKTSDGYKMAAVCWIFCSLLGALPFYFSGNGFTIIQSFFESVAGFTTTGATVIQIATMPNSLILWRSIENWLGGMGILILVISIFPNLGFTGQSLAQAETTGPTLEKLGAKFSDTGKYLYLIYSSLTLVLFLLLWAGPLDWYDALINALSCISTAGLVITNSDLLAFESTYIRGVILIFTILSSLNYALYFLLFKGKWKTVLRNFEARVFLGTILTSTILIALVLKISGTYSNLWQAVKDSLFQVVSFISTSGYYVCNYTRWPTFAIILLFILLFMGGCSLSTTGSLKVSRIIVIFKLIKRGIFKQIHPNSVKAIVIKGEAITPQMASGIVAHTLLYFLFLFGGILCLSLNNLDLETTITSALGLFTNTGVALGVPGYSGYFGMFNPFSQLILCVLMTAGRLEIYSLSMLFISKKWITNGNKSKNAK